MEIYFVDSNIFFYAKIRDKKFGESCAAILGRIADGSLAAATSTLTILETSNALRKFGLADEVEREVDAIYSMPLTVHELLNVDTRLATQIFQKTRVSPYDCAHAAVMRRTGLRLILSADGLHFDRIPGLKRVDPIEDLGKTSTGVFGADKGRIKPFREGDRREDR